MEPGLSLEAEQRKTRLFVSSPIAACFKPCYFRMRMILESACSILPKAYCLIPKLSSLFAIETLTNTILVNQP
jgi:hypothetical protein